MEDLQREEEPAIAARCAAADAALAVLRAAEPGAGVPDSYLQALVWIGPKFDLREWTYDARIRHAFARATVAAPCELLAHALCMTAETRPPTAPDDDETLADLDAAIEATPDRDLLYARGRARVTRWLKKDAALDARNGTADLARFLELARSDVTRGKLHRPRALRPRARHGRARS